MRKHKPDHAPPKENRVGRIWDPEIRLWVQILLLSVVVFGILFVGASLAWLYLSEREPTPAEPMLPPPTVPPSSTPSPTSPSATASPTSPRPATEATATLPSEQALRPLLYQMSLADKIGQMMIVGFHGQSLQESPELTSLITKYRVGGLVLVEPNAHDPQQIALLVAGAQELATHAGARVPLFIAINHEGGIVIRITEGTTGFPGNMALAATGRPEYAFTAASMAAQELRAMGINMNLAPVLDVNDNPLNPIIGVRSFGESPDRVARLGRETIKGFQHSGVVAVAKHFPGHGSTAVDSHVGLPVIDKPAAQLEQVEIPPFQVAIDEGVDAIMTAHIVVPAWETTPDLPASLSAAILTGMLRETMGFDGIIVSDALGMRAITSRWKQEEAAIQAVKAGTDIVLSTGPLEAQIAIHQALVSAVRKGEIPPDQIDRSVLRILSVKHKYGLFGEQPIADLTRIGSTAHQAAADEIALSAITLLKDDASLVPIPPQVRRLLLVSPSELPPAQTGQGTLLGQELRQRGFEVTELVFDPGQRSIRTAVHDAAIRAAPGHDLILFGEWELIKRYVSWSDRWQETLVAALQKSGTPVIVTAWRDPGAIIRLSGVPTFVIAYGATEAQVKAVAQILTGQASPQGRLPMTIPH